MFHGSIVALVTPFQDDKVDVERLRELVEFHIDKGTHALVAAGTTGESGVLTYEEKCLVIQTIIDQAKERLPVIAGTGLNATRDCIALSRQAMNYGAHAVLIMTPCCIRPTQEGLFQHYSRIAAEVPVPIILYNVSGRTACDLLPETAGRLSSISNIIGIKEANGSLERIKTLREFCNDRLDIFSGDDPTAASWLLEGAKGVISVTANIVPAQMAKMCDAAMDVNKALCMEISNKLAKLNELLFIESNPIPVKWALSKMDLINDELRSPLTSLSESNRQSLESELVRLELIQGSLQ